MRSILISNVIATGIGPMSGIQITGLQEQPIEGVRLENIRLEFQGGGTKANALLAPPELENVKGRYPEPRRVGVLPAYGVFARHVRNLELANISVSFVTNDFRPAAMFSDVQGLEIDNFKPQVAAGVKPVVFADNVSDITMRNSPALEK
jgi:hypothetical protein